MSEDGSVSVEFKVAEHERYTVLTIAAWRGIADRPGASLGVSVRGGGLHLTELDYMGSFVEQDGVQAIEWRSPSRHFGVNPPGAFAVFEAADDEAHDETLLHIWVDEQLAHPDTGGAWDLAYARQWLGEWQETFGRRSQFVVNAASLEELYELVPYAERAGADEVYIFTNTWRPDPFWPMTDVNWALNRKVFPNGRKDLRAYSDHLAERGMRLALHYVSGGIGLHDPVYGGARLHDQLATWGTARLVKSVDGQAMAVEVKPDPGLVNPAEQPGYLNHIAIQAGDEVMTGSEIDIRADGTWLVKVSARGAYDTPRGAHAAGAPVKFLVVPYAANFVPDNSSDLLYEIADHFAALLNECRVAHAEFDGAEIHTYDGRYGYIKFAQRIYEKVDHAISGHDSSARAPRCFFEYRFKSTQRVLRGTCGFTHGNWLVPFQIDSASRPAATLLDAHFFLSQGHPGGAMGISKPEPMFGVTVDMLATHGLTEGFFEVLKNWKEACLLLTPDQHAMIESSLERPAHPMPEASRHRVADTVYTVERSGGGFELIPVRVMTRPAGDIRWQLGQEFGPVSPRQFTRVSEPLDLINPYAGQCPEIVIRVLPAGDARAESVPFSDLSSGDDKVFDDKDFFVEGNEPGSGARSSERRNIDITPSSFSGLLEAANPGGTAVYNVRDLPVYEMKADLSGHRGMAVEVEGDGSGALLLIQLEGRGCRDYVIPIDFAGLRTVEVSCGEVSWARADWGWRMGTKTMDYSSVARCRIGLGMIPAGSNVSVHVRRVTALAERNVGLENPRIRINDSELQLEGVVPTGHYLAFNGRTAGVFDANWHRVGDLAVAANNLIAANGSNRVVIDARNNGLPSRLEVQCLVRGDGLPLRGG